MKISMAHGGGGRATNELIRDVFADSFKSAEVDAMEDAAVVSGSGRIAVTTDSFVVEPPVFPGGDIGRLCVCGTVNDLLMRGAEPEYLTCGFVLQEGLDLGLLKRIADSMADAAGLAGVRIVAGDTKVVEGNGGLMINTAGIGFVADAVDIGASRCRPGDAILVSGDMGDHHAAILSARLRIDNTIESDCAPLCDMVRALLEHNVQVHAMRDVTRGGLATTLKELAEASGVAMAIEEDLVPVSAQVRDFCGLMGLDPLYMGNEGKMVAIVAAEDAERALRIMRGSAYGSRSAAIGRVLDEPRGAAYAETSIGGRRVLDALYGEGLPRIC